MQVSIRTIRRHMNCCSRRTCAVEVGSHITDTYIVRAMFCLFRSFASAGSGV
eukprot:SAG31_NODE_21697_length_543_cov_0.745495_1_plen_51_part_01